MAAYAYDQGRIFNAQFSLIGQFGQRLFSRLQDAKVRASRTPGICFFCAKIFGFHLLIFLILLIISSGINGLPSYFKILFLITMPVSSLITSAKAPVAEFSTKITFFDFLISLE